MIQRDVLLRNQVRTINSSERQQRMKVYFELNQQYKDCLQPCRLQPAQMQQECQAQCEKIFDKYCHILKDRYQNQNKHRIDQQVSGTQIFYSKKRYDRQGWFYNLFGVGFGEWVGYNPPPQISPQQRRI